MEYIYIILTIILSFTFHPLYNNFTSLLTHHHYFLYFGWLLLTIIILFLKLYKLSGPSNKKYLYLISALFIVGSCLPYHPATSDFYSSLHVGITFLAIVMTFIFIKALIKSQMISSYKKANQANFWLHWQISIIIILLMMFGTINGIVEIVTLSSILITLKQLS